MYKQQIKSSSTQLIIRNSKAKCETKEKQMMMVVFLD